MVLFYIPSGIVVAHLVKEMPLEGGLYQWAKLRFTPLIGFLVALNIWLYCLLVICKVGLVAADNVQYAFGPQAGWISTSRLAIIAISTIAILGLMLLAWRGLSVGKWVNNFGGYTIVFLFGAIIVVAIPRWFHGSAAVTPLAFTFPAVSLLNFNLLGKMGFGAFGGFDGVGIFAGECRSNDPAKPLRLSVWIAGPLISAMFIAGTAGVLAYVHPESIDLVAPMTQVLSLGAPRLATASAFLLIAALMAQNALSFSTMIRLPMVAGWDHLLPDWFSRLDPRYRTPLGSVLFAGAAGLLFVILANVGTGNQEAFQLLDNTSGILYAICYLVLFGIPLVGPGEKASWGVRVAALSGFLMTFLYVVLSVFPIIDVQNPWLFTAKIAGVIVAVECAGAAYYWRAMRDSTASMVVDKVG